MTAYEVASPSKVKCLVPPDPQNRSQIDQCSNAGVFSAFAIPGFERDGEVVWLESRGLEGSPTIDVGGFLSIAAGTFEPKFFGIFEPWARLHWLGGVPNANPRKVPPADVGFETRHKDTEFGSCNISQIQMWQTYLLNIS